MRVPATIPGTGQWHWLPVLLVLVFVGSNIAVAKVPPPGATIAPMLEEVLPAVVNISTRTRTKVMRHPLLEDPFFSRFFAIPEERGSQRQKQSLGSGVIVSATRG